VLFSIAAPITRLQFGWIGVVLIRRRRREV
jgi:hypothetical protein